VEAGLALRERMGKGRRSRPRSARRGLRPCAQRREGQAGDGEGRPELRYAISAGATALAHRLPVPSAIRTACA